MRKILKQLQLELGQTDIWSLKLSRFLFLLFLPAQLAIHFWPPLAYVYGLRVDYLSPAIYLSDVLFLIYFLVSYKKIPKMKWMFVFVFGLFVLLNIMFSFNVFVTLYKWIKVFEWGMIVLVVSRDKDIERITWVPFLISTIVIFITSWLQLSNGHTTNGLFYFLGERSFNISTPGIALVNILGHIYMRPYSIFSHPNSMAGFELITFFLFLRWRNKSKLILIGILLSLFCVLLSFSKGAYISLIISGLILLVKEKRIIKYSMYSKYLVVFVFILSFAFLLLWPGNFANRGVLFNIASNLFVRRPILGVGLGAFVGEYSSTQPVHNIFVLVLVETGVVGLILFFVALMKFTNQFVKMKDGEFLFIIFVSVLITGLFDHYWLTLAQNFLLTAFLTGLMI